MLRLRIGRKVVMRPEEVSRREDDFSSAAAVSSGSHATEASHAVSDIEMRAAAAQRCSSNDGFQQQSSGSWNAITPQGASPRAANGRLAGLAGPAGWLPGCRRPPGWLPPGCQVRSLAVSGWSQECRALTVVQHIALHAAPALLARYEARFDFEDFSLDPPL